MQTPKSNFKQRDAAHKQALRSSSDSVSSSPHQTIQTPKDRSPKTTERWSPRGCVNEKRSSKLSDLEACIAQLQEELKKAKDQANSFEMQKRVAQQEVEEGKRQISAISAELKDTNRQLIEISSSEDDRLQELCKISQERDKAWESELEAVRKQHSMDLGALASAMYEIQKLKRQLEMVTESEAVQTKRVEGAEGEVRKLQFELGETLTIVERLQADMRQCRESEVHAQKMLSETQRMLDTVRLSNTGQFPSHAVAQSFISSSPLSDQSENYKAAIERTTEHEDRENINQLKQEICHLKSEMSKLRAASDTAEVRYQEEYIQSTLQIRSAYELVEVAKSESRIREAELEAELKKVKADMEELLAKQKKENDKPRLSDKENVWAMELKKARASLAETKACLLEKEKLLEAIEEEKEKLKLEIRNLETEKTTAIKEAAVLAEAEKVSAARMTQAVGQLDAAQAANTEMEAELRRLTVQCDQWRKAAEAAAVMLTTGSGKYIGRSESLDSSYNTIGRHLGSPDSDEMDDDTSKKKNGSMLQKIGVLWKKSNSNKQM
ncbi:unnamed protein product [Rhodiola kirilowii]